jgi:hypothetical protein
MDQLIFERAKHLRLLQNFESVMSKLSNRLVKLGWSRDIPRILPMKSGCAATSE